MTASNAEKIAEVIEKRQPMIKAIEDVQRNFNKLSDMLQTLEAERCQIIGFGETEFTGPLGALDILSFHSKIAKQLGELEQLKRRFSRGTLNIGVIGFARQGKSRLLRSISGLDSTVIPDGDQAYCTGVRSTIYHRPQIEPHGEIWFYTARSFLDEVIAPYYSQEELRLGRAPVSIEQFAREPLPMLPDIPGYAVPGAKYNYLQKYKNEVDKYLPFLSERSPLLISLEKVREYVAQETQDHTPLHAYRAVQEARIYCAFPREDVGQIALIDMPGLGDMGIGDQKRLIEALKDDIDVALFVRMPGAKGDGWDIHDTALYDLVREALPDLPIDLWSFMVLNRKKADDNLTNCENLQRAIESEGHMSVVDCFIADCSDPLEVEEKVLGEVLDYLASRITAMDKQYAQSCQDRVDILQEEVAVLLNRAEAALGNSPSLTEDARLAESREFKKLFKERWESLTSGLERLVKVLSDRRHRTNVLFEEYLDKVFAACDHDIMPSPGEIKARRDSRGGYDAAYSEYLDEIRTALTHHFLILDDALKLSMEEAKGQLATVLLEDGYLGELPAVEENGRMVRARDLLKDEQVGDALITMGGSRFLAAIAQLMSIDFNQLREPFHILARFELSYRGFIQYRIREYLDGLTPDRTPYHVAHDSSQPDEEHTDEVRSYLKALHDRAVGEIENELRKWLSDANMVAFAMLEEFKDQVLRAKDVQDQWEFFYEEMRSVIWPEVFKKLGEKSYLRKQWQELILQARQANQIELFRFLR